MFLPAHFFGWWAKVRSLFIFFKVDFSVFYLNLSLLESIMETCDACLTFESVDEILWCDRSNETSSAVLSLGTIYI